MKTQFVSDITRIGHGWEIHNLYKQFNGSVVVNQPCMFVAIWSYGGGYRSFEFKSFKEAKDFCDAEVNRRWQEDSPKLEGDDWRESWESYFQEKYDACIDFYEDDYDTDTELVLAATNAAIDYANYMRNDLIWNKE